jgi:aminopeptidase N
MTKRLFIAAAFLFFIFNNLQAQSLIEQKKAYTMADTLRGSLRPERTCYDVTFYELNVKVDTATESITGSNKIFFKAMRDFSTMQIDLYSNMKIINITFEGRELRYRRVFNAVFVDMGARVKEGSSGQIMVNYYGKPTVAKRPPWDGGFTWSHDINGKPWIGVSCEGMGASLWWPCKDYLGDEPDSMRIICTIPGDLVCVINGNEESKKSNEDGSATVSWFVSYPINIYNVSLNIADYVHFSDEYTATDKSVLALDYYVLSYNEDRAREQFKQVKPMLSCYEKFLGKYPFWNDGYALVETPYLGMEHQSAIAYGNKYKTGYAGTDYSRIGLDFDYIIIHESAHEWWGNSVSCSDLADMWIHESFATYTESIYVEYMYGTEMALKYINAKKPHIENKKTIVGIYGVNEEGSGDMYSKGALFLNTLRHIVNNDTLWWATIKCMSDTAFKMKNIGYDDVVAYFSSKTGRQLAPVFEQYLKNPKIPVFTYQLKKSGKDYLFKYKWKADVNNFNMPVFISANGGTTYKQIDCTDGWKEMKLTLKSPDDLKINDDWMYIEIQKETFAKGAIPE